MPFDESRSNSTDACRRAIESGADFLRENQTDPDEYALVEAECVLEEPGAEALSVWRLTFKRRELLATGSRGIVGKGGEIFVEVDVSEGSGRLLGYGE